MAKLRLLILLMTLSTSEALAFIVSYTIKPPAMQVCSQLALASSKKPPMLS